MKAKAILFLLFTSHFSFSISNVTKVFLYCGFSICLLALRISLLNRIVSNPIIFAWQNYLSQNKIVFVVKHFAKNIFSLLLMSYVLHSNSRYFLYSIKGPHDISCTFNINTIMLVYLSHYISKPLHEKRGS